MHVWSNCEYSMRVKLLWVLSSILFPSRILLSVGVCTGSWWKALQHTLAVAQQTPTLGEAQPGGPGMFHLTPDYRGKAEKNFRTRYGRGGVGYCIIM